MLHRHFLSKNTNTLLRCPLLQNIMYYYRLLVLKQNESTSENYLNYFFCYKLWNENEEKHILYFKFFFFWLEFRSINILCVMCLKCRWERKRENDEDFKISEFDAIKHISGIIAKFQLFDWLKMTSSGSVSAPVKIWCFVKKQN